MSTLSDRMQSLLKIKKMTYQDLAELTGVNKSTICRYLNGTTAKIPIDRLWKIASALGTTPEYLVGNEDEQPLTLAEGASTWEFQQETQYGDLIDRMDHDSDFNSLVYALMKLDATEIKPYAVFMKTIIEKEKGAN